MSTFSCQPLLVFGPGPQLQLPPHPLLGMVSAVAAPSHSSFTSPASLGGEAVNPLATLSIGAQESCVQRNPPDLGPGGFGPGKGRRRVARKQWPFFRVAAETAIQEGACMGLEFKPGRARAQARSPSSQRLNSQSWQARHDGELKQDLNLSLKALPDSGRPWVTGRRACLCCLSRLCAPACSPS